MRFLLYGSLLIATFLVVTGFAACATPAAKTGPNLTEIRKACKSGVAEYSDDEVSFGCFNKEPREPHEPRGRLNR